MNKLKILLVSVTLLCSTAMVAQSTIQCLTGADNQQYSVTVMRSYVTIWPLRSKATKEEFLDFNFRNAEFVHSPWVSVLRMSNAQCNVVAFFQRGKVTSLIVNNKKYSI